MKHKFLFFFLLFVSISSAQTGTIKIQKPKETPVPAKDSSFAEGRSSIINVGCNYTFKNNRKIGFEAGFTMYPITGKSHFGIGLQYCVENNYYELSAYNQHTHLADVGYLKSQNKSEYIKIPIEVYELLHYGANGRGAASLGLAPEYLIKNKNEFQRLYTNDFNRFNVAGFVSVSFVLKHFRIGIKFSKDVFENLKDRNIYDLNGVVTGKQKSRTNLISFSLSFFE